MQLTYVTSLLKLIKQSWPKPSATSQIPRRMEALYKISGTDTDFLTAQPLPNSVVVKSTQYKSRIRVESSPMNKEGKKLDTLGKRQYSYSTFTLRVGNYLAAMGAYQRHLWNKNLPLLTDLPEEARKSLTPFIRRQWCCPGKNV